MLLREMWLKGKVIDEDEMSGLMFEQIRGINDNENDHDGYDNAIRKEHGEDEGERDVQNEALTMQYS